MSVDVLAIGAHMGDEVAWGMALAAHRRQGLAVGMLHLTPGEKGHKTMPPEEYGAQKRAESQACAEKLEARWWALDYRDGELPVNDEVKFAVCDVIREAKPKVILTHWRGSIHKDHTAAADNLPDALFYADLPVLVEDIERWEKAMRCYALFRGEVSSFAYLDYYRALARTRGCEIGGENAVTFAVPPASRRRRVQTLTD